MAGTAREDPRAMRRGRARRGRDGCMEASRETGAERRTRRRGREAEAAAEKRKREKTENLLSPLPRGFWDQKGGPLCMGKKTNSSNPHIKTFPGSRKWAG